MTKKLLILFLGAALAAAPFAGAAIRRGALTNDNGLSNSSVTCIYQDSSQLMWFGTWDGLNVYNGSGFRTYKFEPDNPNTISNNVIRNIVEEAAGIVWVATDYGINRIDTRRDRIDRFYPGYEQSGPAGERVFSVAASPDGEVFCAATGWGIARYDARTQRLAAFNIPHFNSSEIRGVYAPAPNTLLLHTVRGRRCSNAPGRSMRRRRIRRFSPTTAGRAGSPRWRRLLRPRRTACAPRPSCPTGGWCSRSEPRARGSTTP